jgi:hypothetical protein
MSTRRRWLLALTSIPLVPILIVLLYGIAARVQLGYWPSYGLPDPKELYWPSAVQVVAVALVFTGQWLTPVVFVASLISSVIGFYKSSAGWRHRLWPAVTAVAFVVWFWLDPGGLFGWFWD